MVIILIVGNAIANNVTVTESTIDTESEELTIEQLLEEAGKMIISHSTTPDLPNCWTSCNSHNHPSRGYVI